VELYAEVDRLTNVLKDLGVEKVYKEGA